MDMNDKKQNFGKLAGVFLLFVFAIIFTAQAGAVLFNGTASPPTMGSVSDRVEGYFTTVDANVSIKTDNLSINNKQLQASLEGKVVPITAGYGLNDAIDPATTDTPVQDCLDLGAICLIPPTTVDNNGTLDIDTGEGIQGWGQRKSIIRITKDGVPGVNVTGGSYQYIDGVKIIPATPSSNAVGLWQNSNTRALTVGTNKPVLFGTKSNPWGDSGIHMGAGGDTRAFQSDWGYVEVNVNTTNPAVNWQANGPAHQIDSLNIYSTQTNPVNVSSALYVDGTLDVHTVNIGANALVGIVAKLWGNDHFRADFVNFEPGGISNVNNGMYLIGGGLKEIGKFHLNGVHADETIWSGSSGAPDGNTYVKGISYVSGASADECLHVGEDMSGPVSVPCDKADVGFTWHKGTQGWLKLRNSPYLLWDRGSDYTPDPNLVSEGMELYNMSSSSMVYYDGTSWVAE